MARPPVRAFRCLETAWRLAEQEMDLETLTYLWMRDGVACGGCGAIRGGYCACFSRYESIAMPDPYETLPEMLENVHPDRMEPFYRDNGWFPECASKDSERSCIDAAEKSAEAKTKGAEATNVLREADGAPFPGRAARQGELGAEDADSET